MSYNFDTFHKKKRVLVAMSGGVDSSVAAALLVEQGYDVVGVTMQVWDYSAGECDIQEGNGTCCSSVDVDDARSVADFLKIPFYVANCEAKFQAYVIDDFVESYLEGRTPIPCVNCNTYLKFDHLVQKMKELDCDLLATGHYAQIVERQERPPALVTSSDDWKDQTYFLFTLNSELLPRLTFPVGGMTKPEVRAYAERLGLPVAKKRDSTGICFVGNKDYSEFMDQQVAPDLYRPGQLKMYPSGEVLGEHAGIHLFTYGQRKGLGVYSERPLYVVKIDAREKIVWLGHEESLYSKDCEIKNINLLDDVKEGEILSVKIRFHHKGAPAAVKKKGSRLTLEFLDPQRSITPGQAAVFYRDKQLVGGGWIV